MFIYDCRWYPVRVVVRERVRDGVGNFALLPYGLSCANVLWCANLCAMECRKCLLPRTGCHTRSCARWSCDGRSSRKHQDPVRVVLRAVCSACGVRRSRDITVPRTRGQNWYQCGTNQWRLQAVYGQPLGAVILLRAVSYSTRCYE